MICDSFLREEMSADEKTIDASVAKKRILIVDRINGYKTINEAFQIASFETTIRVMPGIYRESLVLDKNVTIIGVGKVEEIIIIGAGKSAISSTAKQALIQNVTLQQEDSDNPCVDISDGGILIEGCDISGGNNCVAIHGTQSDPIIRNNLIHEAKPKKNDEYKTGNGIYFYENAKGTIEANEIFKNEKHGVYADSNTKLVVRKNRIYENKKSGIWIDGKGMFEANEIFKNDFGISVGSVGDPIVCSNQIHENILAGIAISGKGTFEENVIFKNKLGIFVFSNVEPIVRNNQIYENKLNGIQISGKGLFETNEIFKNEEHGIYVDFNAEPVVRKNRIYENNLVGIAISGKGMFEENEIFKNEKHGVYVDSKAAPVMCNNRIYENKM